MSFNYGHVLSMFAYATALCKGVYGSDKISLLEQYYLMAIEHGHIFSIHNYALALCEGIYGSDKISLSEQYYLMAVIKSGTSS
jgi:hypothetical protein